MSGGYAKIDGAHKKITGAWGKIDGTWRKISVANGKIDGVWKEAWKNAFPKPSFLDYPSKITRGDAITWVSESIAGAAYDVQLRYNGGDYGPSHYSNKNTGQLNMTVKVENVSVQLRIRAVDPTNHDKESAWLEGPVRSLTAQTLDKPTGLTYPSSITRGDKITIKWKASSDIKYTLQAVYNDGKSTVTIYNKLGGGSVSYTVPTSTSNDKVQFKIRASQSGYMDSSWTTGTNVKLTPQKLGRLDKLSAPKPYQGQTITISWDSIPNAKQYLLERQYNDGTWTRAYFGSNRTFTSTVSKSAKGIQWRVRATAPDYEDGDWRHSEQMTVALPPLKTTTWTATKTASWRSKSDWGWREDNDRLYQGAWNEPPWWGNHKGLAFFNYASIQKTLAGKDIERVRIYFYRINAGGYVAGQKIKLWTHNYASQPSGNPSLSFVQGPFSSFARGEGKWITVDKKVAERIRDGSAKGIALHREDELGYLFMSSNVKLEVQYR